MNANTSDLITLRRQIDEELHKRFADVFTRHRRLGFAQRQDQLFSEHWTPETAAADYRFESYECGGDQFTLVGARSEGCFTYRIAISFPARLADDPEAIDTYFRDQYELCRANAQSVMPIRN